MAAGPLGRPQLDAVARMFQTLGEPTRLEILQRLQARPMTVTDLVEALGAKQANVSKQLGLLYAAGLVGRQRRGSTVEYSITEPMVFDLCRLVCDKLRRDAETRLAVFRPTGRR